MIRRGCGSHQDPWGGAKYETYVGAVALATTAHAKTVLQSQIDATDRQIDRLVYELYDLTDEEIAIVEEATA